MYRQNTNTSLGTNNVNYYGFTGSTDTPDLLLDYTGERNRRNVQNTRFGFILGSKMKVMCYALGMNKKLVYAKKSNTKAIKQLAKDLKPALASLSQK